MNRFKPEHAGSLSHKIIEMIIHDIKIPLDSLADNIRQLKYQTYSLPELNTPLSDLISHVGASRNLMDNILSWSKLFIHNGSGIKQPVLIKLQTDLILQSMRYLAAERHLTVSNLVPELPQIRINLPVFEFVFRNMLIYAIRECECSGLIRIDLKAEKKQLIMRIASTGLISLAPVSGQNGKDICETSRQEPMALQDKISLDLCNELLNQHKGKMWTKRETLHTRSAYFSIPAIIE